jgi:class 3 adenylate cyclase
MVIDNAFVSIAYGGLIILSALAYRVVFMKVYETKDFSLLTPEDLVSSLYIFLGCATQISASGVFAYYKTPTMGETGSAELCCYQYIVIVVVVLITILPARVSNLQTSHSLELISDFQHKKKQNVDLLNQILPPKVAYDIMVGSNFVPTQYDKIAVFFCDLERFAKQTSADSDPFDVVNFMNDLYLVMDHIFSSTTNLYKLDMSSNIFICAGGILDPKHTPIENTCEVVDYALVVIETVRNLLVTIQKQPVELKIGIHMGKCLGAVVGSHLPKFVLMGNGLNVSSALEYRGNFGKISVSATTAKLLMKTGFYEINEIPRKSDQNESVLVNAFEIVGPSANHPKLTPEYFSSVKAETKKILDQAINQRSKLLKVKYPKKVENNIIQYYLDSKKNIRSAHY